MCQDVLSYQRVIDSVLDKAQSLARSSTDPRVTTHISQVNDRYRTLCQTAKVSLVALGAVVMMSWLSRLECYLLGNAIKKKDENLCCCFLCWWSG